jgi:parallel beta-helix repeat protein
MTMPTGLIGVGFPRLAKSARRGAPGKEREERGNPWRIFQPGAAWGNRETQGPSTAVLFRVPRNKILYANAPTVVVSSNTTSNCTSGVYLSTTVSGTVSNNTITGIGTFETGFGFICFPTCIGITVSGNQIFNTAVGATMKNSGETGSIVFNNNTISGVGSGLYLFLQPNNTVSNNTITDAAVGVYGTTGNTVTGNTYRTVTTLTEP